MCPSTKDRTAIVLTAEYIVAQAPFKVWMMLTLALWMILQSALRIKCQQRKKGASQSVQNCLNNLCLCSKFLLINHCNTTGWCWKNSPAFLWEADLKALLASFMFYAFLCGLLSSLQNMTLISMWQIVLHLQPSENRLIYQPIFLCWQGIRWTALCRTFCRNQ